MIVQTIMVVSQILERSRKRKQSRPTRYNAMFEPSRKTSKSSKSILLDLRDEDYQYKNRGGEELQSASLTASGSLIPPVSPVKRLKR